MAKFGFDTSEVDVNDIPSGNYDPIPDGEYTLECLEAEEKETASGGEMIKAKFRVVGGEFDNRFIWQNFNTVNKNETAQKIGRQQLVAWSIACGKPDCDDTDKLIGKKFQASVDTQKGTGGYKDSNRIRAFLNGEAEKPARAPAKAAAPVKAAAPAGEKKANPWD
jgi:hypothetical protein